MSDRIDKLIQKLKSSWSVNETQDEAAEALGRIGDASAVKSLIKALGDGYESVRQSAAEALAKIGFPAVEPLIRALGDGDEGVRWGAAELLGKIGDSRAVEPLIKALGDDKDYVRRDVAKALGKIGDARAVESLISALGDKAWDVRSSAVEALGKIGGSRAVEPLIRALGDNYVYVRRNVAWALWKIGDARAVEPLIKALGDSDGDVREKAAGALKNIINSNHPLLGLHPHLLCKECLLRSKKESAKAGVFKSYTYIACRCCNGSINLLRNVKKVIGLIVGDVKDYKQDGEKVYVNLWSETEKKARNADIDILEIRESDGISYDWAVNAVLNMLKNDVSRPRGYVKGIPVIIKGNPPLSENSVSILKNEFGGIAR